MDIVLVRHGETAWNAEKRLQGHIDIGLNAEGQRQATALAQALQTETFDAIFSSDLRRAVDTAQAVADTHAMTVVQDVGLRERCFGAFEGLQPDTIAARYPEDYARWRAHEVDARFPDGERIAETMQEFFDRVTQALTRIAQTGQYRKIMVVAHGGVLDCMYRWANDMALGTPRQFDMLNASINRLTWNGTVLAVVKWGDVDHLQGGALDEIDR